MIGKIQAYFSDSAKELRKVNWQLFRNDWNRADFSNGWQGDRVTPEGSGPQN